MADRKISELAQITGADVDDANDELAIVDASATQTKAITRAELMSSVSTMSITGDLTVDTNTLHVDSANNRVGIGTSSPEANLHVDVLGGTFTANAGTAAVFQRNANTLNGCNVALIAGNASTASLQFGDAEDQSDGQVQYSHIDRSMRFQTAASEAVRIDSSGNLLVGKSSTANSAQGTSVFGGSLGGLLYLSRDGTSGTKQIIFFRGGGTEVGNITTSGSTTSYNTSSDERLKENIADAQPASDLIDGIQVRQFDWKVDGEHQRYGMIAQELETVAPEAVTKGETEDDMWSVDYSKLVPMLVKEIQDLRKRVAELET